MSRAVPSTLEESTLKPAVARDPLENWEVTPAAANRIPFLDGLRGIAILMVVIGHGFYVNPAARGVEAFAGRMLGTGSYGVFIFFVLSGFVISLPFFKRLRAGTHPLTPPGYARRRLVKIVPPFYLSLLFFAAFYAVTPPYSPMWQKAFGWAIGLQNFVTFPGHDFNGVAWTLIVEAHFYLALPFAFWLFRGLSLRSATFALFTLLVGMSLLARWLAWPEAPDATSAGFYARRFPGSLIFFAPGVLFAGLYVQREHSVPGSSRLAGWGYLGLALLPVVLLLHVFLWSHLQHPNGLLPVLGYTLSASFTTFFLLFFSWDQSSLGARFLAHPALRFAGIISYEWYLFHQPFQIAVREYLGSASHHVARYALLVGGPTLATFILAALIYRYFSLPLLRWGRGSSRT